MGFSELAIYALGLACIARSMMAFTNPQAEYALNGLKHTATSKDDPSSGPIYMLGIWELSVGILLLVHQMNRNDKGVTALLGLMSLYKAGVAVLLWRIGSEMSKIAGNVATAVALLTWAVLKSQ
jgi:cytochrome c biogenesis protein CcdA